MLNMSRTFPGICPGKSPIICRDHPRFFCGKMIGFLFGKNARTFLGKFRVFFPGMLPENSRENPGIPATTNVPATIKIVKYRKREIMNNTKKSNEKHGKLTDFPNLSICGILGVFHGNLGQLGGILELS